MSFKYFEPVEIKLDKKSESACELCQKEFNIITRQHQCKRCFRVVCDNCTSSKRAVFKLKMKKETHKLCVTCKKESDFIVEHIDKNRLSFGKRSEIGSNWNKHLGVKKYDQLNTNIEKHLNKLSFEVWKELWDSYNYSMREFIGWLAFQNKETEVYEQVKTVYEQILRHTLDERL